MCRINTCALLTIKTYKILHKTYIVSADKLICIQFGPSVKICLCIHAA